jgi:hypothetical protein
LSEDAAPGPIRLALVIEDLELADTQQIAVVHEGIFAPMGCQQLSQYPSKGVEVCVVVS